MSVPWSNLGASGLKVSQYIIGCMQYGSKEWAPWVEDDEEKIFKILKKAYDSGIRTFDTADVYSNGLSEILVGKFLEKYKIKRDKVVIMTKVFFPVDDDHGPGFGRGGPHEWQGVDMHNCKGLSRSRIIQAAKDSVRRLGTYIDIYQIHRYDENVSGEEVMKALNYVVEQGYTRYIGASSMKAVQFAELQFIAEKNGWFKFINMQGRYSLLEREDEHEMNYFCNKSGVGLTPYFALSAGRLARPLQKDLSNMTIRESTSTRTIKPLSLLDKDTEDAADVEVILRVEELAKKKDTKMVCIALAWLVSKGAHPIVGIGSEDRIDDLVESAKVTLTEEEIKFLEEPYKPKLRVYLG
uniref:Aldo-keto reductase n=1 Tax=Cyberlindnera americana TaxID=36016 RepID=A0A5P8N8R7_9ASCO|nr:aldo-keto reductase [Cyberlindnera americana]